MQLITICYYIPFCIPTHDYFCTLCTLLFHSQPCTHVQAHASILFILQNETPFPEFLLSGKIMLWFLQQIFRIQG